MDLTDPGTRNPEPGTTDPDSHSAFRIPVSGIRDHPFARTRAERAARRDRRAARLATVPRPLAAPRSDPRPAPPPGPSPAPPAPGRPAQAAAEPLSAVGPRLWGELHRRALAYPEAPTAADVAAERAWLAGFARRVPCGECLGHWLEMVRRTPPDLASRAAYWRWTVERHDETNRRLGRPEIGPEEALRIHQQTHPGETP